MISVKDELRQMFEKADDKQINAVKEYIAKELCGMVVWYYDVHNNMKTRLIMLGVDYGCDFDGFYFPKYQNKTIN